MTFDTLKFADSLKAAGVPAAQAEAEALTTSDIATRADLLLIEAKIDKLAWMLGIVIALAVANFAKQFF